MSVSASWGLFSYNHNSVILLPYHFNYWLPFSRDRRGRRRFRLRFRLNNFLDNNRLGSWRLKYLNRRRLGRWCRSRCWCRRRGGSSSRSWGGSRCGSWGRCRLSFLTLLLGLLCVRFFARSNLLFHLLVLTLLLSLMLLFHILSQLHSRFFLGGFYLSFNLFAFNLGIKLSSLLLSF